MTTQSASLTRHAVTQIGDPIRIQIPAAGIDPIGSVKPAVADHYGLSPTLRFDTGVEMIAGVSLAIPDKANRAKDVPCRIGWCATTNTGDVKYSILYKWLISDTVVNGAEDGTLTDEVTVNTTASGYTFTSIIIPAPAAEDRVLLVQLERNGTDILDTCAGAAHVIGILFDFEAGT